MIAIFEITYLELFTDLFVTICSKNAINNEDISNIAILFNAIEKKIEVMEANKEI